MLLAMFMYIVHVQHVHVIYIHVIINFLQIIYMYMYSVLVHFLYRIRVLK